MTCHGCALTERAGDDIPNSARGVRVALSKVQDTDEEEEVDDE